MKWFALVLTLSLAPSAWAVDTASCDGTRGWQQQIVRGTVHGWFHNNTDPDNLVSLIQAEHGIVACASGNNTPVRLHFSRLGAINGLELPDLEL